jgi:hypothetical protein
MSYNQGQPQLGATFVPGGFDDYYMPAPATEVISPAPQRFVLRPFTAHLHRRADRQVFSQDLGG